MGFHFRTHAHDDGIELNNGGDDKHVIINDVVHGDQRRRID